MRVVYRNLKKTHNSYSPPYVMGHQDLFLCFCGFGAEFSSEMEKETRVYRKVTRWYNRRNKGELTK